MENLTSSDAETAEELNAFFQSVFTQDTDLSDLQFQGDSFKQGSAMSHISITEDDVFELLHHVDANKSCGDDGVHPRVLKECATELTRPVYLLYKKSLDSNTVPTTWKNATITPLYKSDDRDEASNYRPISITSQVGKLLEKHVRKQVMKHFTAHNLLSKDQHGFRSKKSCMTNLLESLDYITDMVDGGLPVDAIFLDFKKGL